MRQPAVAADPQAAFLARASKGSQTLRVFFRVEKNPGCCGRPEELAKNWKLL
jgi:hypothetical protein